MAEMFIVLLCLQSISNSNSNIHTGNCEYTINIITFKSDYFSTSRGGSKENANTTKGLAFLQSEIKDSPPHLNFCIVPN